MFPLFQKYFPQTAFRQQVRQFAKTSRKDSLDSFNQFSADLSTYSRAQIRQDIWALWESEGRSKGYFVEIGAGDGLTYSNTYMLEKFFGWRGVLAEPHPELSEKLRQSRGCFISTEGVYSSTGNTVKFIALEETVYSRLLDIVPDDSHELQGRRSSGTIYDVKTISLLDLLRRARAPRKIDFMSIDTEGSELEILKAFDFGAYRIKTIAVEHNYTPHREQLYDLLTSRGYVRKWQDVSQWDDWYVLDG